MNSCETRHLNIGSPLRMAATALAATIATAHQGQTGKRRWPIAQYGQCTGEGARIHHIVTIARVTEF